MTKHSILFKFLSILNIYQACLHLVNTTVNASNLNSRNRSVKSEFRKQQIIDATLDCIDQLGLSQTTLASIAKKAAVSQGIVVFHFETKERLLESALKHLSNEYSNCWQSAIQSAGNDPLNRLKALVKSTFSPGICNRKKISIWYAFWGEARSRPKYQQVCGQKDREFSDTLLSICIQLEAQQYARLPALTASLSIEGMIDGLWQNFLLDKAGFKRQQAITAINDLIEIIYPNISVNHN